MRWKASDMPACAGIDQERPSGREMGWGCRTGAGGLQCRAQQPEKPRQEVGRGQIVKGLMPRIKRRPYPWTGGLKQGACQICILECSRNRGECGREKTGSDGSW